MPGLVGEVRVSRHRIHFDAHLFELVVVVCKVTELGRADKCEIGRIEKHHGPFAAQVGVGHGDELAVVEGRGLERFDSRVDQRTHRMLLGCRWKTCWGAFSELASDYSNR